MTCITPIGPGPAGFRLAETKPAPAWSNWADPLAARTVWTRQHPDAGFVWVIPLRRDGDWSGLMHRIPAFRLAEAEQ